MKGEVMTGEKGGVEGEGMRGKEMKGEVMKGEKGGVEGEG